MLPNIRHLIGLFCCFCCLQYACQMSSNTIVNGATAPDIALPNRNQQIQTLSQSHNEKLVLVEFWASWCAPCREEHTALTDIYNTYKDTEFTDAKGFSVYSVSLDKDAQAWKNAIEQDQLPWDNHVIDVAAFKSVYTDKYGFRSIPTTFLLDKNGTIIGINLTPNYLVYELNRRKKS